jgi:hypothetical protein
MMAGDLTRGRSPVVGTARQRDAAQHAEGEAIEHKAGRWAVLWLSRHSWHLTDLSFSQSIVAFPTSIIAQMFYLYTFCPEILILDRIAEQCIYALYTIHRYFDAYGEDTTFSIRRG